MQIDLFVSDVGILSELGARLKTARIRAGLTQAQLAEDSGVAKTTVERAENGGSVQLLNIVKILRTLNALGGLELLLPSTENTPMENLNASSRPKRVRVHIPKKTVSFKWGDEQ